MYTWLLFYFADKLPVDFKGEAITFKTTTSAVLDTLEHCVDLVTQREESWRNRLDKESDRRIRSEHLARNYFSQIQKTRGAYPGPDLEVCFDYHLRNRFTIYLDNLIQLY